MQHPSPSVGPVGTAASLQKKIAVVLSAAESQKFKQSSSLRVLPDGFQRYGREHTTGKSNENVPPDLALVVGPELAHDAR